MHTHPSVGGGVRGEVQWTGSGCSAGVRTREHCSLHIMHGGVTSKRPLPPTLLQLASMSALHGHLKSICLLAHVASHLHGFCGPVTDSHSSDQALAQRASPRLILSRTCRFSAPKPSVTSFYAQNQVSAPQDVIQCCLGPGPNLTPLSSH